MSLTTFRTTVSGLTMTWAGDSVSGETHVIPQSSPYAVYLDRVPKVLSTGTSMLNNIFSSAVDMAAAGVSFTIDGSPGVIDTTGSPSAGEAFFQITDSTGNYGYSTRVLFNSANAGLAFVINYTGYASNLAGQYITRLQEAVTRLESYPECAILSLNEYSAGRFDNTVADGTSIMVLGARGDLLFTTGRYAWTTTAVDLTTGDAQVSAFTDVDGYKQIGVWLIDNSGSVAARIVEGAEATTPGGTTAPAAYAGDAIYCGVLIVQGDGTGAAGGIEDVAQSVITSHGAALMSSQANVPFIEFSVFGSLVDEEHADAPIFPGVAGVPVACYGVNVDMGDDDTALEFDILRDNTTSIFSTNPTIVTGGGGGTVQTVSSTAFSSTDGPWSDSEYLSFSVISHPTNGQTLRVRLYYREEA